MLTYLENISSKDAKNAESAKGVPNFHINPWLSLRIQGKTGRFSITTWRPSRFLCLCESYVRGKPSGFIPLFLLAALLFFGCSQTHNTGGTSAVPAPSVIRGNGELAVGWAAQGGLQYEVWYGQTNNSATARRWEGTITRSGIAAGVVITGLVNGNTYYVWIKLQDGRTGMGTSGVPAAPPDTVPEGFAFVSGGTVTGSAAYAMRLTIPPGYIGAGTARDKQGVFVEGRTVPIEPFFMAKHEVTRGLWYEVQTWAESNGYFFQNTITSPDEAGKNKPVTGISWRDAVVWSNALSIKRGFEPVYLASCGGAALTDSRNANGAAVDNAYMDRRRNGFRLPTEAEREFAARGGNPGKADWMFLFAGSNTANDVAWYHGNSPFQLRDVGTKAANRLGIYDLSGNAQEWGWDRMRFDAPVTAQTPVDGEAHSSHFSQRPMAGGGVGSNITMSVVADRWGFSTVFSSPVVGFRVVRGVESP